MKSEYSSRVDVLKDVKSRKLPIASAVKIMRQLKQIEQLEQYKKAS